MYRQSRNDYVDPTYDTRHIQSILDLTTCIKHSGGSISNGGNPSDPCWSIPLANGEIARGVCNHRAKKAGMVGKVSAQSLNTSGRGTIHAKRR